MGNECELEFYDFDQTHELTLTLEPKFNLSFILELASVSIPFIVKPKSSFPQNHVPLLDKGLDQYDCMMIFQDWSYNWKKFHARKLHDLIHIGDYKNVNRKEVMKGGFYENSQYLDRTEMLGPMRLPPELPP